jgi:hypothetical protein
VNPQPVPQPLPHWCAQWLLVAKGHHDVASSDGDLLLHHLGCGRQAATEPHLHAWGEQEAAPFLPPLPPWCGCLAADQAGCRRAACPLWPLASGRDTAPPHSQDEVGWNNVGFHNNGSTISPNLDGLAATGLTLQVLRVFSLLSLSLVSGANQQRPVCGAMMCIYCRAPCSATMCSAGARRPGRRS